MMDELKAEFLKTNDYQRRLQILSLSPFSKSETMRFFETTDHMVTQSRKAKKEHGILPVVPSFSKGKVISDSVKTKILNFYESDDVSRVCAGKKDVITMRDGDGNKVQKQKRLILGNLRELYSSFKSYEGSPHVGFSTFASLRPRHCVLAGSSGTHTVCVCTHHQNPKLQVAALGVKGLAIYELMRKSVCDMNSRTCMLHTCNNCPREKGVRDYLNALVEKEDRLGTEVRFKKWLSVDRCTLVDVVQPVDEFVSTLSDSISALTVHHFVADAQSKFFKHLKESVADDEAVVVGDFAENYAFIVQDAVQGYHWQNLQCTLHPFVVYRKTGHASFCFVSDCIKHDTAAVAAFQSVLVPHLVKKYSGLRKIHYFSDGCGGQYKNRYNFMNICRHHSDFFVDCEWHFFATAHGKNACDGIAGIVKRSVSRASLQRPLAGQILTPTALFDYCVEHVSDTMTFFYVSGKDIEIKAKHLLDRFKSALDQGLP